jgi:hypothetical protein
MSGQKKKAVTRRLIYNYFCIGPYPDFYNFYCIIYFTDAIIYTEFSYYHRYISDITSQMTQIKLTQTLFSYCHSIPYKSHPQVHSTIYHKHNT